MSVNVPGLELRAWDAAALRRQAIDLLEATASADVLFFNLTRAENRLHYSNGMSTSDIYSHIAQFNRRRVFDDSLVYKTTGRTWTVREPAPQMNNRFSTIAEDYPDRSSLFESTTHQQGYAPIELNDQARMLLYDGDRFFGSLSAIRRGRELFRPGTLRRIRSQTPTLQRLLLLADRIEQAGIKSPLHLICDESGRVLFADDRAAYWLTARRRDALVEILRTQRVRPIDGLVPTFGWVDDGHRKLRHVVLRRAVAIEATPWRHLSETQRQIVTLALRGLPNTEIARVIGIARSTVKYHLGQATDALGVSGRSGLRDALDGDVPTSEREEGA